MRNTLLIILTVGISFLGCSDDIGNNIVSTPIDSDTFSNQKNSLSKTDVLTDLSLEGDRTEDTGDFTDFNKIEVSKVIDGQIGGQIDVDTTYINDEGRIITIDSKLKFPLNSFQGTTNITIVFSDKDLSVRLYPHMTFMDEVKLDVIYTGVDLEANGFTDTDDIVAVDYAFFGDDGTIEIIANQESKINWKKNEIKVIDANLLHFSRYGWVR